MHSAPFKAAGWRTNPALIKRTHSPPIPTGVASEYFQAPRLAPQPAEDEGEETVFSGGGTRETAPPSIPLKSRRRQQQMQMEDDDSSDLSDDSDDEGEQQQQQHRGAQQIKFAKMPLRSRAGSSPGQSSNLRQMTSVTSSSPRPPRRGSQSTLETVKERTRRDTVTSSEISSENEFDASGFHRQREAARAAAARAAISEEDETAVQVTTTVRVPKPGSLLEDDDSDASSMSGAFVESIDSASILDAIKNPLNQSLRDQVVGTPPREFTRRSTIRKSAMPPPLQVISQLPPPRPMSTIRPLSMVQPTSLLSAALKAKKTKPTLPFDSFASLSGQGDPNPIMLRIFAPFSTKPSVPFEVLIRRTVHQGEGGDRAVTIADTIGLSLWRYNEEKREPPLPEDKLTVNWWNLRMVEEDGEIDDDFPPLDRTKPLTSFTTANNKAGLRGRSNSKVYDIFALSMASPSEHEENVKATPEFEKVPEAAAPAEEDDLATPKPQQPPSSPLPLDQPPENPLLNTAYRAPHAIFADLPQTQQPTQPQQHVARGEKRLLRIHIHSPDIAPGQMITLDVSTETWMAEVLDIACRKRQLDRANHVLKLPGSGTVVMLDRTVGQYGAISELDLCRRRFTTDGPLLQGVGSLSSSSPRQLISTGGGDGSWGVAAMGKSKKAKLLLGSTTAAGGVGTHPLAREVLKADELLAGVLGSNYKKYVVWRKQPMRLLSEKLLVIDGDYVHIMPASSGGAKMLLAAGERGEMPAGTAGDVMVGGKSTTTVHFSNVVGCKVSRKHPSHFKVRFYPCLFDSKSWVCA